MGGLLIVSHGQMFFCKLAQKNNIGGATMTIYFLTITSKNVLMTMRVGRGKVSLDR